MRPQLGDQTEKSSIGNTEMPPERVATLTAGGHSAEPPGNVSENPGVGQTGEACEGTFENSNQSECGEETPPGQPRKRKSTSGPPTNITRLLRSKSKEKPEASEANNPVVVHDANEEKKRKRRKRKRREHIAVSEFSRIRGHLRYLLQRIKYEKTLIEAYSGEGWKGQSLEKIKLEKELERAKAQIFRYKLKIRDLFQRLDDLLAQGRLPASLFDNEGQIDSEDIFCAKCGSEDLPADNDIILCDGACERGFHQFCLEPPLLKEDIPPDEEGWLCPGCDCKVDCIDLLNDLQGTNLSITDSWEKVFPEEAAAAASGGKLDEISGLPSDDSEDDDYNPENPDIEKSASGDESSSDDSDFYSASDGMGEGSPKDDATLGLPSEDSEDDDYNPDAPDKDEHAKTESSSSDFTSDSEDFGLVVDTNGLLGDEQGDSPPISHSRSNSGSQEGKTKVVRAKRNTLKDELSYLMQSDGAVVSGKRHIERLDYKTLHDETYGNVSSDSSDEDYEDYEDGSLPKERENENCKTAMASCNQTPSGIQEGSGHTSGGGKRKKLKAGGGDTTELHSSGKKKTYGEFAIERLYEYFKENQYPDRDTKENLGEELGLTAYQVSKWFENARFSYRHSSSWETIMNQKVLKECPSSPQMIGKPLGTESKSCTNDASCNGVETLEPPNPCPNGEKCLSVEKSELNMVTQDSGEKSRELNAKTDNRDQVLDGASGSKSSKKHNAQVDALGSQRIRRSSRLQRSNNAIM